MDLEEADTTDLVRGIQSKTSILQADLLGVCLYFFKSVTYRKCGCIFRSKISVITYQRLLYHAIHPI